MDRVILYKDTNGNIQQVRSFKTIVREEIQQRIDTATAELQEWQDALVEFDRLSGNAPEDQPTEYPTYNVGDTVPLNVPAESPVTQIPVI